jgi:uncharacterized protein YndB with AHSA1/START domain
MQKEINHTYFFPHNAETVWQYLTNAELMALWLMDNDFQPIVGYDFQFKTRPLPNMNFDGNVYCKVLEIQPCKKLVYSWKGGPGDGRITLDSIVTWTLTEKDNDTELQLVHSDFKEVEFMMYSAMNEGWRKNIHKIADLIKKEVYGTTND